jgi:hypothetical protein
VHLGRLPRSPSQHREHDAEHLGDDTEEVEYWETPLNPPYTTSRLPPPPSHTNTSEKSQGEAKWPEQSALESLSAFAALGLSPALGLALQSFHDAKSIQTPTPIQAAVVPKILEVFGSFFLLNECISVFPVFWTLFAFFSV